MAKIALICMYDTWALGLRTISNALTEAGHEAVIIHFKLPVWSTPDYFAKNTLQYQVVHSYGSCNGLQVNHHNTDVSMWTHSEIHLLGDLLEELSPDIIGLSTRCVYEIYLDQIFDQIKRVKGSLTIAGGHDASFRPELYLKDLDLVCIGEGEDAMIKVADSLDHKNEIHNINNLAYKTGNKYIQNLMATPSNEIDYFYSPQMNNVRHFLIENNNVFATGIFLRDKAHMLPHLKVHYYTMMGRGCVGKCTFCSAGQFRQLYTKNKIRYQSRRLRPIENIIRETKKAKELGYHEIYFLDSFFLAKRDYLLSLFEAYREEVALPFLAQFEPDQILAYPEILDEAERAGFRFGVIGIQSGSEQINKQIFQRSTPHKKLIKFAHMMVDKRSISIDYHFITHNPFETQKYYDETIQLIKDLPKENTNIVLRPLYAFKNTAIENMISQPDVSPLDKDFQDKLLVLYLIRYCVPDFEFDKVSAKFDELSFGEIKIIYSYLKRKYKSEKEWTDLGKNCFKNKQYTEAARMYRHALEKNQHFAPALFGMGWCLFLLKKYEQASHYLDIFFEDTCIKNKSDLLNHDMLFWYLLGECSFHLNRPEKAIACFLKVRELTKKGRDQEHTLALTRLAWAYSALDRISEGKASSLEAMDAQAKMQGGKCLSREYLNSKSRLLWECKNGHQWQATPEVILGNGSWCPRCLAKETKIEIARSNPAPEFIQTTTLANQKGKEIQYQATPET